MEQERWAKSVEQREKPLGVGRKIVNKEGTPGANGQQAVTKRKGNEQEPCYSCEP